MSATVSPFRCCRPARFALLLTLASILTLGGMLASSQAPAEYQLKAVLLYNFAQFVDWPPTAFTGDRDPLVIGVLGEDPFGAELDIAVRDETVNRRPLVVRRFHQLSEIDHCHILFISSSEASHLDELLVALKGQPILTVGDFEGFSQHGGMIRFAVERNRIRLKVRLGVVDAAKLSISSKLLRVADVVS